MEKKEHYCPIHNKDLKDRGRGIWDHRAKLDSEMKYDKTGTGMWYYCQGHGWRLSLNQ